MNILGIAALSTYNFEVSASRQQRENRPVGADSAREQLVGRNNGTQDAMRWPPRGLPLQGALAEVLQVSSAPGPQA